MELFIIAGGIPMSIHKVTLMDGHTPMIKDFSPMDSETGDGYCNPQTIEPALWFKVMVVDSISIDCTKREIVWNNDRSLPYMGSSQAGKRRNPRRVAESMYMMSELYKFDSDLDELFDTLEVAVVDFASSKMSRDAFNSEVLRMLHCHVLPLIKLMTEDVPKMKRVYADEEEYIKEIEEAIMEKDKQVESIAKAMHRQRNILLSNFVNMDTNDQSMWTVLTQTFSKEMAQVLAEDCECDIYELDQQLNHLQREVDEVKKALDEHEGMDGVEQCRHKEGLVSSEEKVRKQLLEKRDARNECHGKLNEVLTAKENLRLYISEAEKLEKKQSSKTFMKFFKGSPEPQLLPFHNIYLGMRNNLEKLREKIKDLVSQKVLVLSVKEALRMTLEELEVQGESLGLDVSTTDGSCAANVLRQSRKPQKWRSFREKVSDLLSNPSNQACLTYNNFIKTVVDCCQAAIFETAKPTGPSLRSDGGGRSKTRTSSGYGSLSELSSPGFSSNSTAVWKDDTVGMKGCEPCALQEEEAGIEDFDIVQNDSQTNDHDPLRQAIDELTPKIQDHFSEMCELIQTSLETHTEIATKMVWQCYEHHFYKATHQHLMELYNSAFKSDTHRLQLLSHLTLKDIGLDNSVIMSMLQEKTANTTESSQSEPDPSPTTDMNLGKLSTQVVEDATEKQATDDTMNSGLQWVENHYSMSVDVVYDNRQSWPHAPFTDLSEKLEASFDVMRLQKNEGSRNKKRKFGSNRQRLYTTNNATREKKDSSISDRDVKLQPEFQKKLSVAQDCLKEALVGWTPITKLQSLMRCLHEVTNCWSEHQLQFDNEEAAACSDDATDMLIILLLNCDVSLTASLYPHVQFLGDMLPPQYMGGQYDYCLTQFSCTYQFLQNTLASKYGSYIK